MHLAVKKMLVACPLVLAAVVILGACSRDMHDHPELISGQQLFDYHCAGCHKASGKGKFLKGVPANKGTELSRLQVRHKITSGGSDKDKMPVFESMTATEARTIVNYLKTL